MDETWCVILEGRLYVSKRRCGRNNTLWILGRAKWFITCIGEPEAGRENENGNKECKWMIGDNDSFNVDKCRTVGDIEHLCNLEQCGGGS